MAITYQPSGYGEYISGLAAQVGASKRAAEERQRAFAVKMAQVEEQMELDRFARQKAWETEKMELASRLDFERQEKLRNRELEENDARIKSLVDAYDKGLIDENEVDRAKKREWIKSAITLGQMGDRSGAERFWRQALPTAEERREAMRFGGGESTVRSGVSAGKVAPAPTMKVLGKAGLGADAQYMVQQPDASGVRVTKVNPTDEVTVFKITNGEVDNSDPIVMPMHQYVGNQDKYHLTALGGTVVSSEKKYAEPDKQTLSWLEQPVKPFEESTIPEIIAGGVRGLGEMAVEAGQFYKEPSKKALNLLKSAGRYAKTPFTTPVGKMAEGVAGIFESNKPSYQFPGVYGAADALRSAKIPTRKVQNWLHMAEEDIKKDPNFKKLPPHLQEYVLKQREMVESGNWNLVNVGGQ